MTKTYYLEDKNHSWTLLKTNDEVFKKVVTEYLSPFEVDYEFKPMFRAGITDGRKRMYKMLPNGSMLIPKGLIYYITRTLDRTSKTYTYEEILNKNDKIKINILELRHFIKTLNLPFEPYDFQEKAVLIMINERRTVLRSSTSSGKSLIGYIFFMYMLSKNLKSVLVVPTISLVDQMFDDFKSYGFEDAESKILRIGGEHKELKELKENDKTILDSKPLVISTWQSLQHLDSSEFKSVKCVLIDEAHQAKADTLDSIIKLAENAIYKIGMTGTIPKPNVERMHLLGTLGKINLIITAGELINRGLATPIQVKALYFNYDKADVREFNRNKTDFKFETDYVSKHYNRNLKVTKMLLNLSKTGNILGTFTNIEHGEFLMKMLINERIPKALNPNIRYKITPKPIKEAFNEFLDNENISFFFNLPFDKKSKEKIFKILIKENNKTDIERFMKICYSLFDYNLYIVNGSVKSEIREYIRYNLENIKREKRYGAIILGSWSVVATGINYKNLHYIVYLSSLKSYTKNLQLIGRGMRLHKSKNEVIIFDIVDILGNNNHILKHFYERLEYYREENLPITEIELDVKPDYITEYDKRGFAGFDLNDFGII